MHAVYYVSIHLTNVTSGNLSVISSNRKINLETLVKRSFGHFATTGSQTDAVVPCVCSTFKLLQCHYDMVLNFLSQVYEY